MYKVKLGIDFDKGQLKAVEQSINNLIDKNNNRKININVDYNINGVEKLVEVGKKIQQLKEQASSKNVKVAMPIDSKGIENSLDKIHKSLLKLRDAFGKVDSNKGTKSLLTSVRDIGKALEGVTRQIGDLNKSLSSLATKDLSLNFDLGFNNSKNKPAEQLDKELNLLKKQAEEYEEYLNKVFSKFNTNGSDGVSILFGRAGIKQSVFTDALGKLQSKDLSRQVSAYKNYIRLIKEASESAGVPLSVADNNLSTAGVTNSLNKIENEANETEKRLKELFSGGINAEKLNQDLTNIASDLHEIQQIISKLSGDTSFNGLVESFNRLSKSLEELVGNAKLVQDVLGANTAATGLSNQKKEAQETAKAFKETTAEAKKLDNVSIDISSGNIDELKAALRSMKVDDSDIEEAVKELNEMNVAAKNVSATFKNGQLASVDIKGVETTVDGLKRAVTVTRTFGEQGATSSKKYSQALDEIAIAADRVNKKLKSGLEGNTKFDVEISDVEKKFSNLSNQSTELRAKIDLLRDKFTDIQTAAAAGDIKELVAANERYEEVLRDVNNQLKINRQEEQKAAANQKLADDRVLFQEKIDAWLTKNSKATKEYGAELLALKAKAESCDRVELDHLEREFKQIDKAAEAAGVKAKSLGDRLRTQFSKYSTYFSAASVFMYVEQGLRSMFEQVVAIDSAMTELKKVTDETNDTYNNFLTNAASKAQEIGTTISDYISSTADFSRLGYDFVESQTLSEVANMYKVVGDEIDDINTASQSVISTMKAFKVEASDSMSIVDKFNEVSNNFAISSGGIGEALTRSASSLAAANNSLDESIALITASNSVVQDPTVVGRLMPTLKMAISVKG